MPGCVRSEKRLLLILNERLSDIGSCIGSMRLSLTPTND
jgi:hypothetical protein